MAKNSAAEWVSIDDLEPWEGNPRVNDHAVDDVARSIERFGFGAPVVARRDGAIIAGHTRLKATVFLTQWQWNADREEWEPRSSGVPWRASGAPKPGMIPVRYLDISAEEAQALALADNKLGEIATWDDEELSAVLRELSEQEIDLSGLGWSSNEMNALLASIAEETTGDDDIPSVSDREPESKAGELYELGPHRLVCGDSTKSSTWDQISDVGHILTLTDPPYNVDYGRSRDRRGSGRNEQVYAPYQEANSSLLRDVLCHVRSDVLVMSYPVDRHFFELADAVQNAGFELRKELVWVKDTFSFWPGAQYQQKHEPILVLARKGCPLNSSVPANQSTVFEVPKPRAHDLHPTARPIQLWSCFVEYHSNAGDIVVDPFGGSGTTLIACAKLGRIARLIEVAPVYCDVIRKRWTEWAVLNHCDPGPGRLPLTPSSE